MKRLALGLVGIAMAAVIPAKNVAADVNVSVTVPAPAVAVAAPAPVVVPPPLEVQTPEMVVVPSGSAYVYMVPNVYGVYFYNGFWFRYYNGIWFRSAVYNSGWVVVRPALVPRVVIGVYPEYAMYLPVGYYRIGWGDFHHHWRDWGHNHHWHHQPWFKREMRRDVRLDRQRHIQRDRNTWHRDPGKRPAGYQPKAVAPKPKSSGVKKTGPGAVKKTGPGAHKVAPSGVHKTGPGGTRKAGPGGAHKVGPGGPVNKPAPGMAPKTPPRGGQGGGHPQTPPHK